MIFLSKDLCNPCEESSFLLIVLERYHYSGAWILCRMLIMFGANPVDLDLRASLVRSLARASERDPYLEILTEGRDHSHSDGWGRILVSVSRSGDSIISREILERSLDPFYRDARARRIEEDLDSSSTGFVEMIHVREASRGMPVNIFSTHPAEAVSREGYRLYLIHNGTVDKQRILEILGVEKESSYARLYGDTHMLAQLMALRIRDGISEDLFREAVEYTLSALNIGVILIRKKDLEIGVGSFYKSGERISDRRNYYKIYRARVGKDLYTYVSSTVVDFYNPRKDIKWEEMPNGFFEVYRMRFEKNLDVEKILELRLLE